MLTNTERVRASEVKRKRARERESERARERESERARERESERARERESVCVCVCVFARICSLPPSLSHTQTHAQANTHTPRSTQASKAFEGIGDKVQALLEKARFLGFRV